MNLTIMDTPGAELPPVHPGEVLNEEFLLPLGISSRRLARAIGIDPRRVNAITQGRRAVTADTALLLGRFFGNSPAFWMGLQSQYDLENSPGPDAPKSSASKSSASAAPPATASGRARRQYPPRWPL